MSADLKILEATIVVPTERIISSAMGMEYARDLMLTRVDLRGDECTISVVRKPPPERKP